MARKTVTDTATEAEVLASAPASSENPWKKMVEIRLPKAPRGGDNFQIASVNGRVYKIKRGETVSVPAPIAEVLENAEKMHDEADAYIEAKQSK